MTSFIIVKLFKFTCFVEHNISYQPCKFQLFRISGSNLTEGGEHPHMPKSSVFLGLSDKAKIALFSKLSNFCFDLRPPGQTPGQDRGAKTRPQGQLESRDLNVRIPKVARGMVRLGID